MLSSVANGQTAADAVDAAVKQLRDEFGADRVAVRGEERGDGDDDDGGGRFEGEKDT